MTAGIAMLFPILSDDYVRDLISSRGPSVVFEVMSICKGTSMPIYAATYKELV